MGYDCEVKLAVKGGAKKMIQENFNPENLYDPLYGADAEERDGALCFSLQYDKRDPSAIMETLEDARPDDFLYREKNEYDENIQLGSWYENPFFSASETVEFASPKHAFMELYSQLKGRFGEREARNGLEEAVKEVLKERKKSSPSA